MGNIIDYLKEYGEYSLLERPFCDEDSLVLAQFSYLKLENIVPGLSRGEPGVTPGEIGRLKNKEELFADERYARQNAALFEAICRSRRFQTMKLTGYINRIDVREPSQFSAVTCLLEDDSAYVAFRGTDETLSGWKEDFAMAYRAPVRSQELSVDYLNRTMVYSGGALIVGGHSKGGNLAVYASMYCEEAVRKRIRRIYNLDGPGFCPQLRENGAYREIAPRIRKIVPHSSVVGMLLEDTGCYETVESSAFGVLQHDPYSWVIKDGKFVTVSDVYRGRRAAMEVLNRWIRSLTKEELGNMIEEIFDIIGASGAQTLLDFSGNWRPAARRMAAAFHDMEKERKKELWRAMAALLPAVREVWRRADEEQGPAEGTQGYTPVREAEGNAGKSAAREGEG